MKTSSIVLSLLFILAGMFTVQAQKNIEASFKKESIKVWGECGMCKQKIETAAKKAGAATAVWYEESKILALAYNADKTDLTKIQQAIAVAGYDTKDIAATDAAYQKLPGCCHYQRSNNAKEVSVNCCKDEAACSKDSACCKDAKCDKESAVCKDMASCKEKGCCKS